MRCSGRVNVMMLADSCMTHGDVMFGLLTLIIVILSQKIHLFKSGGGGR